MANVRISKDIQQGKVLVSFSYDPKMWLKLKQLRVIAGTRIKNIGVFLTQKIF